MVPLTFMKLTTRNYSPSGFSLIELIAVLSLVSLLISIILPSLMTYRKSRDANALSDYIKNDVLKIYSMSRRFSAFCNVFFTLSNWSSLATSKLDLTTSVKSSSGRSTYSPLIARCAEDLNDVSAGLNLLYNENVINGLPDYLFLALNKSSFGFTPRGLSNGVMDTLIIVGHRIPSSSTFPPFCIKVSSITGKVTSGIYRASIPTNVRARPYSLYTSLRSEECY